MLYSFLTDESATNQVASLLRQGADPNFRPGWPNRGTTPLHVAARSKAFEIAKVLVNGGATNGSKDASGKTALETLKFEHASPEEIQKWEELFGATQEAHKNP
jgi:hypothetical protein